MRTYDLPVDLNNDNACKWPKQMPKLQVSQYITDFCVACSETNADRSGVCHLNYKLFF